MVTIGWSSIVRIYVLLGALFVVTLALLAGLLLRMRINQAVKLGDTA
jgi:ABC-type proline/glycine betaine transport system permease subunit